MKIILGSSSPSRRHLMTEVTADFEVMLPNIDEKAIRCNDAERLPLILARAKTEALLPQIHEPAVLVTCDQVCLWNGQLREKPADIEEAKRYVLSYNDYPARIVGGMVVTNTVSGQQVEDQWVSEAVYGGIPEKVVDAYVMDGAALRAAGGIRLESPLLQPYLIELRGEADAFMGLSVAITKRLIKTVRAN